MEYFYILKLLNIEIGISDDLIHEIDIGTLDCLQLIHILTIFDIFDFSDVANLH